ncbi:MAG: hypothetical protein M3Y22_13130 [Pseudomonadota bacterium]|nr:hypothetical protein [Pseudomonadota bacterium]
MGRLMTWCELKRQAAAAEVTDDTPIDAIDCYSPQEDQELIVDVGGRRRSVHISTIKTTRAAT